VGHYRKLHSEDLQSLYSYWFEILKGRNYLEDLGTDRKITVEWILEKYGGKV